MAVGFDRPQSLLTTKLREAINWGRKYSLWPMPFGTACCAIEFMSTVSSYADISRFGAEVVRFSPRQSDLLIVAGAVTYKMADRVRLLWAQMPEPKYVIAMGSCANCGGLFQRAYSVVCGVDQIVPVDLYLPGCPPRPEALAEALMRLQNRMRGERWLDKMKGV